MAAIVSREVVMVGLMVALARPEKMIFGFSRVFDSFVGQYIYFFCH